MADAYSQDGPGIDPSSLLLIVVGADLRAELSDRAEARRLAQRTETWLARNRTAMNVALRPVICTDVWYLNDAALHERPTISLGHPEVNKLSAYFAQHTAASATDERVVIHIDPEFVDLRVCIWGTSADLTGKGIDLFIKQYLDDFLRAVVTQVEPQVD